VDEVMQSVPKSIYRHVSAQKGGVYILPSGRVARVTNMSDGIVHLRYLDNVEASGLSMRREVFESVARLSDYIG
jgi:hypothetical protein